MSKRFVITQGEYCVSAQPDTSISTVLGSCVACCLWDPVANAGGMNHMLLTSGTAAASDIPDFHGVNAMELLINSLLKLGARRDRLRAKAFGGAQMVSGLSDIGPRNGDFVLSFLESENIPCLAKALGGDQARQVVFQACTGAARVKTHPRSEVREVIPAAAKSSDVELF